MQSILLRDLHIDSTSAGSLATQDVGRAITESIRLNRSSLFGWNQAKLAIPMEENVQRYTLPKDFLSITSDVFYNSGAAIPGTAKRALKWAPLNQIFEYRFTTTSLSELINTGAPMYYGIDPAENQIVLAPISSTSDATIDFEYLRDPGTPWYQDVAGTITFYKPYSEDVITSSFTNDWFDLDKGFDLIRYKAAALLWSTVYSGTEEAAQKYLDNEKMWAVHKNKLQANLSRKVGAREIRRWM